MQGKYEIEPPETGMLVHMMNRLNGGQCEKIIGSHLHYMDNAIYA